MAVAMFVCAAWRAQKMYTLMILCARVLLVWLSFRRALQNTQTRACNVCTRRTDSACDHRLIRLNIGAHLKERDEIY